ncbi:MAG TPA: 3D domain-containing protein, partial [Chloroflexota bacterium]|nr:3D domain-containing protein [Chloroflexota bacterium]
LRKAPIAGVIALLCLGMNHGIGSPRAAQVQAQASGTMQAGTSLLPGDDLNPERVGMFPMTTQPSLRDTPPRLAVLKPLFAVDRQVGSAPPKAPPSRGATTLPGGSLNPPHGGQGNAYSPASQAQIMRATVSVQPGTLLRSQAQSPAQAREAINATLAILTKATARTTWFAGPQASAAGLAGIVSLVHGRQASLSSLSLERVLDNQKLTPVAPLAFSRGQQTGVAGDDLATTARRPLIAAGLKMVGVHPAPTTYLQKTSPQTLTRAGYTTTLPGTGDASSWTAATMPGGNASLFWITGYIWTGNKTSTGTYPHWGTVAVDPHVIKLGSIVYIQGLGQFRAEDTGGAIHGRRVDVFVASAAQAYQLTGYKLVSFIPPNQ